MACVAIAHAAVPKSLWVRVTKTIRGKIKPVELLDKTNPYEVGSINSDGNLWAELFVNLLLDNTGDVDLSFDISHTK